MSGALAGWTGRLLAVDLTAGEVSVEDTFEWVPARIGAVGVGLALLWERVPAGVGPFDPENLLYIGVGPLTGTWAPCAGRAVAVSRSPQSYPVEHVMQGSVGGQWPAELKWAGYDGIAITGRSPTPVFLAIRDETAELLDAADLWGLDTFTAQQQMQDRVGDQRAKALVIGPAGEKRGRNAAMIHGTGHALGQGGFGGVAGSKQLKGIVVRGTGAVATHTPLVDFRGRLREIRGMLALMQSVVPSTEDARSRWRANADLWWEGGDEAIPVGDITPEDLARQGLRHCGSDFYMGGLMRPWHVKNSGCTGCVMNCFSVWRGHDLPAELPSHGEAHCVQSHTAWFSRRRDGEGTVAQASRQTVMAGKQWADRAGVNAFDLKMALPLLVQARFGNDGAYAAALPAPLRAEIEGLPWDSLDAGGDSGLSFWSAVFQAMAGAADAEEDGLGGLLLRGTPRAAAAMGIFEDLYSGAHGQLDGYEGFTVSYCAHGQKDHYGPRRYGYPAGLHWVIWNRDPNRHEHNGLVSWSGLGWEQKRRVAEIHFGDPDAIDYPYDEWQVGEASPAKIELARLLAVRSMLKDSLTVCDWVFPNYCCPDPQREYAGDLGLEAELYRAITGDDVDAGELDARAEALVDLYRAITARDWNTTDLRGGEGYLGGGQGHDLGGDYRGHDNLAAWYFDQTQEPPHLDRAAFEEAKTRIYQRLGWDPETGAVTREKLEQDGLGAVADGLAALGLLPE